MDDKVQGTANSDLAFRGDVGMASRGSWGRDPNSVPQSTNKKVYIARFDEVQIHEAIGPLLDEPFLKDNHMKQRRTNHYSGSVVNRNGFRAKYLSLELMSSDQSDRD